MRLKTANRQQQQQQQSQDLPISLSSANLNRASMNEDSRYDIMNGSNSSTGSASAIGHNDDLEQDSGDVIF
jgi:hypothetical protein